MSVRDKSGDVDDPNVSMTDANWHQSYIRSHSHTSVGPKHIVKVENDRLVFSQGLFSGYTLRMIIKPTMKGFWIPVSIQHGAHIRLDGSFNEELIGLQNCAEHVGGKITICSAKMQSFRLVPITFINELNISECTHLLDLTKLPNVLTTLAINQQQLKLNLKHIFLACSPRCAIKLLPFSLYPSMKDKKLENIINIGLLRKGGQLNERQALLQLQTDLIDHDFEEYSNI